MLGFPKIMGTILGDPHNKDSSILGSILGSPCLGKLPYIMEMSQAGSTVIMHAGSDGCSDKVFLLSDIP